MTRHKIAPEVKVFVDGREQDHVHCLEAVLSSNSQVLPSALLDIQPVARKSGRRVLKNMRFTAFKQAHVRVDVRGVTVHRGFALSQPARMDGRMGDHIQIVSRIEDFHFGDPLQTTRFFFDGLETQNHLPTVFNPEYEGVNVPNRTQKLDAHRSSLFIHPDMIQSAASRNYHGEREPKFWTLPDAVYYLCWTLNPLETHVTNPAMADLKRVLPSDIWQIRNHVCPEGEYLPRQLDLLLNPFGYQWTLDFAGASPLGTIRVFARSGGPAFTLKMQTSGSDLDMDRTNLEALSLEASVVAPTEVTVLGDYREIEGTFELVRAWAPKYDAHDIDELDKNNPAWLLNPDLRDVWRKWVLNEAGDYNRLRPEIRKPPEMLLFDLPLGARRGAKNDVSIIQRRRKFEPCITLNQDGSPMGNAGGVFVEYWEPGSTGSPNDGEWLPKDYIAAESRSVRILQKECGIYFDGDTVPIEILRHGANARVRVTATLTDDNRVRAHWKPAKSTLAGTYEQLTSIAPRFKYRKRHKSSRFHGVITHTSERDDTLDMQFFARQMADAWNLATIAGSVTLTGVDFDTDGLIGKTISGIVGRKVDFNVAPAARRYPTVVGIKLNFVNQKTELTLESFRGDMK